MSPSSITLTGPRDSGREVSPFAEHDVLHRSVGHNRRDRGEFATVFGTTDTTNADGFRGAVHRHLPHGAARRPLSPRRLPGPGPRSHDNHGVSAHAPTSTTTRRTARHRRHPSAPQSTTAPALRVTATASTAATAAAGEADPAHPTAAAPAETVMTEGESPQVEEAAPRVATEDVASRLDGPRRRPQLRPPPRGSPKNSDVCTVRSSFRRSR